MEKIAASWAKYKKLEQEEEFAKKYGPYGTADLKYTMGKRIINVGPNDYKRIANGWFSDTLMDILFHWVLKNTLKAEVASKVHIFSTSLSTVLKGIMDENPNVDRRAALATRKVNIFEKEFVIFPFWDQNHWMLVVVAWPWVYLWDSYQPHEFNKYTDAIQRFLLNEAGRRKGQTYGRNVENLFYAYPPCSQQTNTNDCGIYVVRMLSETLKKIQTGVPLESFGEMPDVSTHILTRAHFAKLFYRWMRKQNPSTDGILPQDQIAIERCKREMQKN